MRFRDSSVISEGVLTIISYDAKYFIFVITHERKTDTNGISVYLNVSKPNTIALEKKLAMHLHVCINLLVTWIHD